MTGNFYLFWLLLVTVAFLYNAAVGPLRTAFSRTPIYNVTGVYPASTAAHPALNTDSDVINATNVTYYVTYNVSEAGICLNFFEVNCFRWFSQKYWLS